MRLWRIIAVATVVEVAVASAVLAVTGWLSGASNGWLDALNCLAPLWLCGAAVSGLAAPLAPSGPTRRGVIVVSCLGVLAGGALVAPEFLAAARLSHPSRQDRPMRIVTMNVWKDNLDLQATSRALLHSRADVITVQERSGTMAQELERMGKAYRFVSPCSGRAWDLVVFTNRPVLAHGCLGDVGPRRDPGDVEATWVRIEAPDGRPATIVTTHFGWIVPPGYQDSQSQRIADFLKGFDQDEVILTGDFNLPPWTYGMRRQDRRLAPLQRVTRALPTWPAYWPRMELAFPLAFFPLDHIYAGRGWTNAWSERMARTGSDHYGLKVTFARGEAAKP